MIRGNKIVWNQMVTKALLVYAKDNKVELNLSTPPSFSEDDEVGFADERPTVIGGICVIMDGNKAQLTLSNNVTLKYLYLQAKGNKAQATVTLSNQGVILGGHVIMNGNKASVTVRGPRARESCASMKWDVRNHSGYSCSP